LAFFRFSVISRTGILSRALTSDTMDNEITSPPQPVGESLSTKKLMALIEAKLHLLSEMYEMSISQSDLIAQQDMTPLVTLLSRKQIVMESLQSVQLQLAPFQSQNPDSRDWPDPAQRINCRNMIERCDKLLEQLVVMENRSLDNMVVQRELVTAQLQQNTDAATLHHAYQSSDSFESRIENSLSIEG
jgi:hypothetical protein